MKKQVEITLEAQVRGFHLITDEVLRKLSEAGSSIQIPITNGQLNLGTWQGIYLCEFRNHGGPRELVATIL